MRRHTVCGSVTTRRATSSVTAVVLARRHQRGIPYAPRGTIMDFTSSPRHAGLMDLQRDLDVRTGRVTNGVYDGASFVPGEGAQPAWTTPFAATGAAGGREEEERRRSGVEGLKPWEKEYLRRRLPQRNRRTAYDSFKPELGDSYQADVRTDPAYAHLPDHVRAAQQSILAHQCDSYGEVLRGVVPPPPPPTEGQMATPAYAPPRVELGVAWYALMGSFALLFYLLAAYGR